MFEYTGLWDGDSLAPEWTDTVRTSSQIQTNLPLGYALHNTYIAPVISKPSLATINSIFGDGNTPEQDDPSQAGASGYIVQDYDNSIVFSGTTVFHSRGSSPNRGAGIVVGNIGRYVEEYKRDSSNFGNRVDIWAPGSNIVSSVYDSTAASEFSITLANDPRDSNYKIGSISGTSMASPQVVGCLACYMEQNPNLTQAEALEYLITHSKKDQIGSTGADYGDYQWFGDNGNNRYLFYKQERVAVGNSFPKQTFRSRPASGSVYPRTKIRRKG